jgi:hypothetical protein
MEELRARTQYEPTIGPSSITQINPREILNGF